MFLYAYKKNILVLIWLMWKKTDGMLNTENRLQKITDMKIKKFHGKNTEQRSSYYLR